MRSPRVEFGAVEKREINARAIRKGRRCEICGASLKPGDGQIDHTVPEWTRSATDPKDRRRLGAEDGKLLCLKCHKRKSASEAKQKRRIDRAKKRHQGKLKTRGFKGWRNFRGELVWAKSTK